MVALEWFVFSVIIVYIRKMFVLILYWTRNDKNMIEKYIFKKRHYTVSIVNWTSTYILCVAKLNSALSALAQVFLVILRCAIKSLLGMWNMWKLCHSSFYSCLMSTPYQNDDDDTTGLHKLLSDSLFQPRQVNVENDSGKTESDNTKKQKKKTNNKLNFFWMYCYASRLISRLVLILIVLNGV